MKLTDISATEVGRKATAKLSHQVHKSTVAAGKQPRMMLGTIGISIGQAQSTGLTSRVNEEELDPNVALQLLININEMAKEDKDITFGLRFDQKFGSERPFNKQAAVKEALKIARIGLADGPTAGRMLQALNGATMLTHDGNLKRMSEMADAVEKAGFVFQPHVMKAFADAKALWAEAELLDAYNINVSRLVDFLYELDAVDEHSPSFKFINAALKKLGLR